MPLLRCSDPKHVQDVVEFLLKVHVVARPNDDDTVSASIVGGLSALHEWHAISGYVITWNVLHPGSHLEIVEP